MAGGALFEVVAGADRAFARVASEISGQYVLGLEAAEGDRDAKPHDIEVKVSRKDVEVRARRQFVMVPTRAQRPSTTATAGAYPLRVATYVLRGSTAAQVKLVVTAQVESFSDARFGIRVRDVGGGLVGEANEHVQSAAGPVSYKEALLLTPGDYTLEAGAVDPQGRRAAMDTRVSARLLRGEGFEASDLLLLEADGKTMRLPASQEMRGDTIGVYLELYPSPGSPVDGLRLTLELLGPDGTPRVSRPLTLHRDAGKGLLYAEASLDVRGFPPGAYLARVLVTMGTGPGTKVERAFDLGHRAPPPPP